MANILGQSITSVTKDLANGDSDVILVDRKMTGGIDIGWVLSCEDTPDLDYVVSHTFDLVPNASSGIWHDHSEFSGGALPHTTAITDGNYGFGITGIKCIVTNWVSGEIVLTVVQAGTHKR